MLPSEESIKEAFGDNEYVLSKNKNGDVDDDISNGDKEEDDSSDDKIDEFDNDNDDEDNEDSSCSFLGHTIHFWN
jgi:hypothetical protein